MPVQIKGSHAKHHGDVLGNSSNSVGVATGDVEAVAIITLAMRVLLKACDGGSFLPCGLPTDGNFTRGGLLVCDGWPWEP